MLLEILFYHATVYIRVLLNQKFCTNWISEAKLRYYSTLLRNLNKNKDVFIFLSIQTRAFLF